MPLKFIKELSKKAFFKETEDNIICIMGDWDSVAEGIILTNESIYVNSPKNKDKQFSVKYNKISRLAYYRNPEMLRIEVDDKTYTITTELWSERS